MDELLGVVVLACALAAAVAWNGAPLRNSEGRPRSAALTLSTLLPALALALVAWLTPPSFRAWMQENGPAEWATVFAFAAATALYLARARRGRDDGALVRLGFVALALFALFVAGEEISWGQRLFAFEPPEVFLEHNFQQELNVHNLLTNREVGGFELDTRHFVALIAVGYGAVLPLVRARLSSSTRAPLRALAAGAPPAELSAGFLVVAGVELWYPTELVGEAAELELGLLFAVAASVAASARPARAAPLVVALALALGALAPLVIERALFGSDEERVALARAELEGLATNLERPGVMAGARFEEKKRVHKRVYTAARAGYLSVDDRGEGERDRRWYFLDPWNNPYWIAWSRKRGELLLYSFGPDRKRNGNYEKRHRAAGDDIVVHLAASWRAERE